MLIAALALVTAFGGPVSAQEAQPLEIGIFPLLSVRTLMERFQPLRDHLERSLKRPVNMVTAPDFRAFVERTQAKQYDFVITAPHFARLAQLKAGYRPLVQPVNPMKGVFFVRSGSKINKLDELKGSTIATPDALALVTILGEGALKKAGIVINRDVTVLYTPTHNAAILSLQTGQVDAALASNYQFMSLKPEERQGLKIIGESAELPTPMVYLAGPRMSEKDAKAIRQAILDFAANTDEGKRFLEATRYDGLEIADEGDMKQLDPYIPLLERALKARQ